MTTADGVGFLLDVDDTLPDNDTAQNDYLDHIARHDGPHAAQRYWTISRGLYDVLGYADYLGALELYRLENRGDPRVRLLSSYLLDYPFADRLYPRARRAQAPTGARPGARHRAAVSREARRRDARRERRGRGGGEEV